MKLVIGIAGIKFSGKNDAYKFLETLLLERGHTIARISSGELIRGSIAYWKIPETNRNLQRFAKLLVEELWEGMEARGRKAIISNVVKDIINSSPQDVVVFDGVRWRTDVDMIKSFPQSLIIYIDASEETCRKRTAGRKEKAGEGELMTESDFRNLLSRPTETWIPQIKRFGFADCVVENEGSKEELKELVRVIVEAEILPRLK